MTRPSDEELLEQLRQMRQLHPEWRFGQMVCNLAFWARGAEASSVWDVEDSELMEAARSHLRGRERCIVRLAPISAEASANI